MLISSVPEKTFEYPYKNVLHNPHTESQSYNTSHCHAYNEEHNKKQHRYSVPTLRIPTHANNVSKLPSLRKAASTNALLCYNSDHAINRMDSRYNDMVSPCTSDMQVYPVMCKKRSFSSLTRQNDLMERRLMNMYTNQYQCRRQVPQADPYFDQSHGIKEYLTDPLMDSAQRQLIASRRTLTKRCSFPMCTNSARSRGFCYSHGGGRRCCMPNCTNGAVSRDLCKRHGGGRRCKIAGCKSSAESGGLCYSHGGGRRCNLSWCNARAKRGGKCAAHLDHSVDMDAVSSSEKDNGLISCNGGSVAQTLVDLARTPTDSSDVEVIHLDDDILSSRNAYALATLLN